VPAVCRHWRQLADSPPLLRSLAIRMDNQYTFLPRLRSPSEWVMRRAAGHVRQLRLQIRPSFATADDHIDTLSALIRGMLNACGRAGGLSALDLSLGCTIIEVGSCEASRACAWPHKRTCQSHAP
jgi:hypothetical protein